MTFRIEPPKAEDAPRLADMFYADMVDLGESPNQESMRKLAEDAIAQHGDSSLCLLARNEKDVAVGAVYGIVRPSLKCGGPSIWVEELYVLPGFRQSGIGNMLVEALLDWCESNEVLAVELEAYRMNTAASILYRSHGFDRLPRERYSYRLTQDH
jgi:ribosomal protein S18 acetylase RimI-like enzyme